MEKKLPGVFVNKIGKKANNKSVYYGGKENPPEMENVVEPANLRNTEKLNIRQKLNRVFQSVNYIYKIDVELILKDKKITKRIIGYNDTNIITFDNELIPIGDVIDVKLVQKG